MGTQPNSMESVEEAIKAGAEIIEVDVRVTKDGAIVLYHDSLITVGDRKRHVQDLTLEELLMINQSIITLDDVLPLVKENEKVVNLDLKDDNAMEPMTQVVEKYHMRDQTIITGCEKEWATSIKQQHRAYQVFLNASISLFQRLHGDYNAFITETIHDTIASSCCGININYRLCSNELIDQAMLRFLPICVWTVDSEEQMKAFLHSGVQSITTKEVQTLIKLRQRNPYN